MRLPLRFRLAMRYATAYPRATTNLSICEGHGLEDPLQSPRKPLLRQRLLIVIVAVSAVASACGDAGMLDGLGERGHEYVEGSTTLTPADVTVTTTPSMAVGPVEGKRWYNEELPNETIGDPSFVIASVWGRSDGITRFIQASPGEIASALPNVEFPSLVPENTFSITSQLVFDIASGALDPELSAAFGFWTVTPYQGDNQSVAVLRVAGGGSLGDPLTVVPAEGGVNVRWVKDGYSYELFCRDPLPESVCQEMAVSAVALQIIAPRPAEA